MRTGIAVYCERLSSSSYLIESPRLSIPLLDAVERRLPSQIKHEQYRDSVIRDERKHGHEFSLTAQVPYLPLAGASL